MASVKDLGESKYISKEDVGDGLVVTITGYKKIDVSRNDQPASFKYVLKLDYVCESGQECKPLVVNVTNGKMIAKIVHELYGVTRDEGEDGVPQNENFDNWIGKKIVLWNKPDVEYGGEVTGGIRVRALEGQKPPKKFQGEPNPDWVGDNPPPPTDDDIPY